jgi:outer membrane protein OmpA-like peptidoglycan-associated protein
MTSRIILVATAAVVLAAACATTPKNVPQLEEARAAVGNLTSEPLAAQAASRELQSARRALERAELAWQQKQPLEQVVHLSYLAERQAEIGQVRLAEVRARQQIARGEADRNAVLLEARERQTQLALRSAGTSARDAEAARASEQTARESAMAVQSELQESQRKYAELQAKQTERGMVLTLGDVLFDTGQANLKPGAAPTLDHLAQFLQQNAATRVMIEGHTDSRGSTEYNEDLSRRRATAVSQALESRGTPTDRINIAGLGETLPVASNDTPAGRQRNRRVEIVFSDASGKFADGVVRR